MMSTRVFTNKDISITTYIDTKQTIYFKGRDIAKALGYSNVDGAIKKHVKEKYKKILTNNNHPKRVGNPMATYITEPGVYSLIFRSKLPSAEEFQDWVFSEVLPEIRKKGYYLKFNNPNSTVFKLENEYDLHTKVISYIRRFHPYAILIASLGELQDTKSKRIKSFCKGYRRGQPDVIISNYHKDHRGLCIEFKSPSGNGTLSQAQQETLKAYEANGFKCLVQNDYDLIIREINNYLQGVRIPCQYCPGKFKCERTLESHKRYFHRIIPKPNLDI